MNRMSKNTLVIYSIILISIILTVSIVAASTTSVTPTPEFMKTQELMKPQMQDKLYKSLGVLGLGFAAGLGGLGIGVLSKAFIEGIYRNPETTNKMLVWFFVAFALIEAQVLYTLFFVFQLFFAK
ncbi:MAG: ATP synthase F0 subunit C [bacterium]